MAVNIAVSSGAVCWQVFVLVISLLYIHVLIIIFYFDSEFWKMPGFTLTHSILALKLLFLAFLESGALLRSNLEEALYKST